MFFIYFSGHNLSFLFKWTYISMYYYKKKYILLNLSYALLFTVDILNVHTVEAAVLFIRIFLINIPYKNKYY